MTTETTDITLAVDLGGTEIKLGLVRNGDILQQLSVPAENRRGLAAALGRIERAVIPFLDENNWQLDSVGFGFPGLVDCRERILLGSNDKYHDAREVNLQEWARRVWGVPLHLDNDARLAAIGEWQYGAARGYGSVVVVTLGTGIGSGVIVNNRVLRGSHYRAGNLGGHLPLEVDSRHVCSCGNPGCAEALASTWALQRDLAETCPSFLGERDPGTIGYKEVFEAHDRGDPEAGRLVEHSISVWSTLAVNLIHAFDPEVVVFTGNVMRSADDILPKINSYVEQYAWTPGFTVPVLAGRFTNSAALLGGAYITRNEVQDVFV